MSVTLSNLRPPRGSRHRKVRVGRGIGSKLPKTAGAGNKGQKSRKGFSPPAGFEGGQMPLHRRIPKRGFHNPFPHEYAVLNVEMLKRFRAPAKWSRRNRWRARGVRAGGSRQIKILGDGNLKAALTVRAHAFSHSAEEKIANAGGKVERLS